MHYWKVQETGRRLKCFKWRRWICICVRIEAPIQKWVRGKKKYRTRETLNLVACVDNSTNAKINPQKVMCLVMDIWRPVFLKLWPQNVTVISDNYVAIISYKYVAAISDKYVAVISNGRRPKNLRTKIIVTIFYHF